MRTFWLAAVLVLAVQFVALLIYSGFLFHRFDLTDDFATYSQAWWLIGHGHLNPVDTIQVPNYPFWQSHFELAMWPMALVGRLWPDPLQLLWLQDAAIVATEWIAMLWVAAICASRLPRFRSSVAMAALAVLVLNPWWYLAASFDVHFEVLGLPLVLWSGYSLWRGRTRSALIVGLAALAFGDVVSISMLCVAIAAALSWRVRRTSGWRPPAVLGGAAAAWLVAITLLGGNKGSGLVANYGYLVGARPTATSTFVIERLVVHPWHAIRILADRRAAIGRVLGSAGFIGILSPWGVVIAAGTLGPVALNANLGFLSPTIAFQTIVVIPFVLVGSVLILVGMATGAERTPPPPPRLPLPQEFRKRSIVALGLGICLSVLAITQNASLFGTIRTDWWKVDAPTAAVLRRVLPSIPANAEVIASQGVIGRFGNRPNVFPYLASPQVFPVRSTVVVFVIAPSQGIESVPAQLARNAIDHLIRQPGVAVLAHGDATVLEWHPPPGTQSVALSG
jgi:hypothetical protein